MALLSVDPAAEAMLAGSLAESQAALATADLLILDLALPDSKGVIGLGDVLACAPAARSLVVSGATNPGIERLVAAAGAHGFFAKSAPLFEMIPALKAVLAGETWFAADDDAAHDDATVERFASLTPAQRRVLGAMQEGRLNKQIAHDLSLSEITVKAHIKAILRKLGAGNRTQAILMLREIDG